MLITHMHMMILTRNVNATSLVDSNLTADVKYDGELVLVGWPSAQANLGRRSHLVVFVNGEVAQLQRDFNGIAVADLTNFTVQRHGNVDYVVSENAPST